ncbi:MAG TPA: hypothetical protein VGE41_05330 [Verrucomicrobiae bacterium]
MRQKRLTTILALSLEGGRLEGALVRRTNGSVSVLKAFNVPLSLDPLTNEPELVGQEIRNLLDKAGVREKACAICVPLNWALTHQTKIPELPEADIESLLTVEAERGFPYDSNSLLISSSRLRLPGGDQYATQVAVPREHVLRLESALKAAKLKPVTFSLGIPAMQNPNDESAAGLLALVPGESSVGLQVACGGGVAALRALEGAIEMEGSQKHVSGESVTREIRITLGQMPAEIRGPVQVVKVFGQSDLARQLAEQIRSSVESMGLQFRSVTSWAGEDFGVKTPADAPVTGAFALATRLLAGRRPVFEFMPPKTSAWQQFSSRYSSKKLVNTGAIAATLVLLIAGVFIYQSWQLSSYESEWKQMSPKVAELENLQQQIRKFRPWFDNSMRSLSILRSMTEAFPEDGVVTAKTMEIREPASVTCSGTARDNQALLKTLDRLRATREIGEIKVDQIRGKSPLQFTFNFHYGEKGAQQQ